MSGLTSDPMSGFYPDYDESLIIHFDPEYLITFANHKSQGHLTKDQNRHKKEENLS